MCRIRNDIVLIASWQASYSRILVSAVLPAGWNCGKEWWSGYDSRSWQWPTTKAATLKYA